MVNDSNPRTLYKLYPIKSQSNTIFPSSIIPINHTFWLINGHHQAAELADPRWRSLATDLRNLRRVVSVSAIHVFGGKQGFDQWTDMFFIYYTYYHIYIIYIIVCIYVYMYIYIHIYIQYFLNGFELINRLVWIGLRENWNWNPPSFIGKVRVFG